MTRFCNATSTEEKPGAGLRNLETCSNDPASGRGLLVALNNICDLLEGGEGLAEKLAKALAVQRAGPAGGGCDVGTTTTHSESCTERGGRAIEA